MVSSVGKKKKPCTHTRKILKETYQTYFKRNNCFLDKTGKKRAKNETWIQAMVASATPMEGRGLVI